MKAPRKLNSEQELYGAALRALMRRAYSVHDMRAYLEKRAERESAVPPVLDRLKEHKYLDDVRYALEFARSRADSRRQGRFRIARELRARGVPHRHIEAALDAIFAETDEAALLRKRLQRKLALLRGPLDQKRLASLYRSLLRAGFSADVIRAELRSAAKSTLAELPEPSLEEDV